MATHRGTETTFELTTIERLEQLGFVWQPGADFDRDPKEVVLTDRLRAFFVANYPE